MNRWQRFVHNWLGWHKPDKTKAWFDGCSAQSVCRVCKKNIMQDSQGNWF